MKILNKLLPWLFLLGVFLYFVFLLKPAFTGEFTGTLRNSQLPNEYVELKDFLSRQNAFYRVLWIPASPHYVYMSEKHRSISAQELFNAPNQDAVLKYLERKDTEKFLSEASVKYVIVPFDSEKQIFNTDRQYDEKQYLSVVATIDRIKWLKRVKTYGKIVVYELNNPKDHFWTTSKNLEVTYTYVSPVHYEVYVKNARKGDQLIFSEGYDAKWAAKVGSDSISSKQYNRLNSFILPQDGTYTFTVQYTPQEWVDRGVITSIIFSILIIIIIIFIKKK